MNFTYWNSLRKHPFLLALRRPGHVPIDEERGETNIFAGYYWNCGMKK